ncbi:winged helix-turn-helix transcriptional regulator [Halosimplex litoreum]|uniref:Winged helix-turn-helix transcriptional regulator n=1 Tax=Halosimplex litoreum TaxID=1198301 RepID=A0A7T3FVP4_9EURY|nr:winged helix-turn-helix domain-containing protein [Halosimplex litoreum]QPV61533.1 winged helix-turn-helix transcriptional regulator [Halosimplex litoreum]
MPIGTDRFEQLGADGDGDGPTPGTNAAAILDFLRENPDKAYTQSEIADATEVKAGSVGPTLARLREGGRVDHRGHYWRVSDHERGVDEAASQSAAALASREADDETPGMAAWRDHAVDSREHRDE